MPLLSKSSTQRPNHSTVSAAILQTVSSHFISSRHLAHIDILDPGHEFPCPLIVAFRRITCVKSLSFHHEFWRGDILYVYSLIDKRRICQKNSFLISNVYLFCLFVANCYFSFPFRIASCYDRKLRRRRRCHKRSEKPFDNLFLTNKIGLRN